MTDPFDMLIENLRETVPVSTAYIPKERAYEELKRLSGEDWGYDADAWAARKEEILKKLPQQINGSNARKREAELRKTMRSRQSEA